MISLLNLVWRFYIEMVIPYSNRQTTYSNYFFSTMSSIGKISESIMKEVITEHLEIHNPIKWSQPELCQGSCLWFSDRV